MRLFQLLEGAPDKDHCTVWNTHAAHMSIPTQQIALARATRTSRNEVHRTTLVVLYLFRKRYPERLAIPIREGDDDGLLWVLPIYEIAVRIVESTLG